MSPWSPGCFAPELAFPAFWRSLTGSPGLFIRLWAMPTYEYICDKCGHHFDLFQSISARPLTVCLKEHCAQKTWGKGKVKRAISGGAGAGSLLALCSPKFDELDFQV